MSKSDSIFMSSCVALVAALSLGFWLFMRGEAHETEEIPVETVAAVSPEPNQLSQTIEGYHLFDNGDPTDFMQGMQFFGTKDSLGISKPIVDAYPNRANDFLSIANRHEDRTNYLASKGKHLNQADRWLVQILMGGQINGEDRVAVLAMSGHNEPRINGGIGMDVNGCVCEIWRMNAIGTAPTLLDRSMERMISLNTLAEAPEEPLPELPPLDIQNQRSSLIP